MNYEYKMEWIKLDGAYYTKDYKYKIAKIGGKWIGLILYSASYGLIDDFVPRTRTAKELKERIEEKENFLDELFIPKEISDKM